MKCRHKKPLIETTKCCSKETCYKCLNLYIKKNKKCKFCEQTFITDNFKEKHNFFDYLDKKCIIKGDVMTFID